MSSDQVYPVTAEVAARAHIDETGYQALYRQSLEHPEEFWGEQARELVSWFEPWETLVEEDLARGEIRWFKGARLNVAYNCLDRHLATRATRRR